MLCAGSHNRSPTFKRPAAWKQATSFSPRSRRSYLGQMAQICRTAVIGPANAVAEAGYCLVIRSMEEGIAAAVAGATMADVCSRHRFGSRGKMVNIAVRRTSGGVGILGFGSNLPGM